MPDVEPYESQTKVVQQPKVKKTYRLNADLISELEEHAEAHGMTVTAAVEDAIRKAIREPDASHTPDAALDALIQQLAVKDAQITALSDSLKAAQEVAKAAQLLHAAAGRDAQVLPEAPEDWRSKSLLDRILKR